MRIVIRGYLAEILSVHHKMIRHREQCFMQCEKYTFNHCRAHKLPSCLYEKLYEMLVRFQFAFISVLLKKKSIHIAPDM